MRWETLRSFCTLLGYLTVLPHYCSKGMNYNRAPVHPVTAFPRMLISVYWCSSCFVNHRWTRPSHMHVILVEEFSKVSSSSSADASNKYSKHLAVLNHLFVIYNMNVSTCKLISSFMLLHTGWQLFLTFLTGRVIKDNAFESLDSECDAQAKPLQENQRYKGALSWLL